MKIVHFYNSLYIGGIDSFLVGLANEMSKTENVSICTLQPPKEGGMRNLLDNQVSFYTINDTKFSIWHKIKDIFKIARFIQKNQFDIVHIHAAFNFYILSILLFHRKTKFFYTIHSDAIMENGPISTRLLKIKKIFFRRKLITPITISKTSQESFYKLYNCDSLLIENGILRPNLTNTNPILQYKTSIHTRVFTHVGRICEAKNQLVLCKVLNRLIQEGKDVVLLIIGPQEVDCIYQDMKKYFSNRIIYLGPKNNIPDYLVHSDAMCLPSIYEGLPIVLLEAIAVGCIPICAPAGGCVNVIQNGINGYISTSSNEEDYYQVVKQFLSLNATELEQLKLQCKDSFSKYDISICAKKHLNSYSNNNQ